VAVLLAVLVGISLTVLFVATSKATEKNNISDDDDDYYNNNITIVPTPSAPSPTPSIVPVVEPVPKNCEFCHRWANLLIPNIRANSSSSNLERFVYQESIETLLAGR